MDLSKVKRSCLNPKISVIVPIYNAEKTIERCLLSILTTKSHIEIICINDGSNDNSLMILKQMKKIHRCIRIISHEENKGLYCARITGVMEARAEYIGFVDSDDYVMEGYFDKLLYLIKNNNADIAVGQIINQSIDGKQYIQTRCAKFPYCMDCDSSVYNLFWYQAGRNYHWHVIWNKVYRKEVWMKSLFFLSKQKQHLTMMEDFIFSSVILSNVRRYVVDASAKYVYVENVKSSIHDILYSKMQKNILDMRKAFEIVENYIYITEDFHKYSVFFDEWKQRYARYWKRNIENSDLSILEKYRCIQKLMEFSNKEIDEVSKEDEYFYEKAMLVEQLE